MAFEYNGFIHRDLEPQVRYDAEQIQLLKQANIDINNKIDALPLGGEKVSLTFPAGASEGTITTEQLTKLQASESNYIEMVNDKELYYLNDNGHTDGYLTYTHVGIENGKATVKTLTITVSAKSFVIITTVVPTDNKKVYLHSLLFKGDSSTVSNYYLVFYCTFYTAITRDNADDYSSRIPFAILYNVDNNGNFVFNGIIHSIQMGPPPKSLILAYPGINNIILEPISDSVIEV